MSWRRAWVLLSVLLTIITLSAQASALEVLGGVTVNDRDLNVSGAARLWLTSGVALDLEGYPLEGVTILRATGGDGLRPFFGVGAVKQSDDWVFSTGMLELAIGLEMDISWLMPDFRASIGFRTSIHEHCTSISLMYNISSLFDFSRKYSDEDLYLLARLISAEARGESFEGQVAVGAVVLNRVKSPEFPDTIREVIYEKGQFTPVTNGSIDATPTSSSISAAKDALSGNDPSRGALFYCNPKGASEDGLRFMLTRTVVATIGQHVFYR